MEEATRKQHIEAIVSTAVTTFAAGFRARHEGEIDNPEGVINSKVHNVFIAALGSDIQYYPQPPKTGVSPLVLRHFVGHYL